jgi:hypothetical protein
MGYISGFHQIGRRIYQSESVLGPGPVVVVECNPYPGIAGSPSFDPVLGSVVIADAETGEGRIEYRSFVVDCNLMDRHYSVAASMKWLSNTLQIQIQSVAMVVPYIAAVGAGWPVVHMVMVGRWSDRRLAI